jgi:hypothetical protein
VKGGIYSCDEGGISSCDGGGGYSCDGGGGYKSRPHRAAAGVTRRGLNREGDPLARGVAAQVEIGSKIRKQCIIL